MRLKKYIKWLWRQTVELIYPPFCVLCDCVLDHGTDKVLCDVCEETYPILEDDLCVICSKPLQDKSKERCLDCRKRVHFFEEGKALWVYEEAVKEAVKAFKYHNRREIGVLFAKAMARYYNENIDWPIDMVVPVPLHAKKLHQRGFSQTLLLANTFSKMTHCSLEKKVLFRMTFTIPQEGLTDKDRIRNVMEAFKADEACVRGKSILLIDDVYTTGATLDGCGKALIDAGAENVYFMAVAIGRGY